jgi:hypothetical protein
MSHPTAKPPAIAPLALPPEVLWIEMMKSELLTRILKIWKYRLVLLDVGKFLPLLLLLLLLLRVRLKIKEDRGENGKRPC